MKDMEGVFERYLTTARGSIISVLDTLDGCARQENATTLTDECELVSRFRQIPQPPSDAIGVMLFADAAASFVAHILDDHAHHYERAQRSGVFDQADQHMSDQIDACIAEITGVLQEMRQGGVT